MRISPSLPEEEAHKSGTQATFPPSSSKLEQRWLSLAELAESGYTVFSAHDNRDSVASHFLSMHWEPKVPKVNMYQLLHLYLSIFVHMYIYVYVCVCLKVSGPRCFPYEVFNDRVFNFVHYRRMLRTRRRKARRKRVMLPHLKILVLPRIVDICIRH